MRKFLAGLAIAVAATVVTTSVAVAAPPGLPEENPNKNSLVIPVICDGFNNEDPFLIWVPNGNAGSKGTAVVGHPIGVDVPIGIQKFEGQGSFDRTIECVAFTPDPVVVYVMPAGRP